MTLGDLLEYPFLASVWGTAAAWVGTLGTVMSLATAAYYYRSTVKREERAQAQQIRFAHIRQTDDKIIGRVYNDSDRAIYDIQAMQARRPFEEVVSRACEIRPVGVKTLEGMLEEWKRTTGGRVQVNGFESTHIGPGKSFKVTYPFLFSNTEKFWIKFRDANGKLWSLELDTHSPVELKEPDFNHYTWAEWVRHPEVRKLKREYKDVDKWVKENYHDKKGK
ncbi:hypothetical protein [Rhodococcus erythropolis]|uniref:Uncharacterized protein n=1 Tax=Rhodococcus erythropolis (strain PR4 / NBRC 100887) TaxID=234621 RepID=C0ZXY3_RHOE4|nr:hypothetical protein [Rhodococcus erythropolis]BAH33218.1 hypothetical protein RER_25100 [Rhodococcus erythropolis PR4]